MTTYLDHHAEQVTVTGWKCAKCGRFFGDHDGAECAAQYCCATTRRCEGCGGSCERLYTKCRACREKRAIERHAERERAPFRGGMIYSELLDEWFSCPGTAVERLVEWWHECPDVCPGDDPDDHPDRLTQGGDLFELARFVLGEPDNGRPFEIAEFLLDSRPEDGSLNFEGTAEEREIDAQVNNFIARHAPYCYWPSTIAWNGEVAPEDAAPD